MENIRIGNYKNGKYKNGKYKKRIKKKKKPENIRKYKKTYIWKINCAHIKNYDTYMKKFQVLMLYLLNGNKLS